MHQYNVLYFANYSTLSIVRSTELAIFTLIYTNVRDDDGSYEQFSSDGMTNYHNGPQQGHNGPQRSTRDYIYRTLTSLWFA